MRLYENEEFDRTLESIETSETDFVDVSLDEKQITELMYFLTPKFYYAVIVDDYPYEIKDKPSLLEALIYQCKLITTFNLNWDAVEEGFNDALERFSDFKGICLIFREKGFRDKIRKEAEILEEIIHLSNEPKSTRSIIIYNRKM